MDRQMFRLELENALHAVTRADQILDSAERYIPETPNGDDVFKGRWLKEAGLPEGSPKAGQWFRNDPQVKALIKADGKLGLGLKADQDYQKFLDE